MKEFTGGTEQELAIFPVGQDGYSDFALRKYLAHQMVVTNNRTLLYGIPSSDGASGSWLFNGGRLYPDMSHPEYATPECSSLDEIVYYEWAGRTIATVLLGLVETSYRSVVKHQIVANNTDYSLVPTTPYTPSSLLGFIKAIRDTLLKFEEEPQINTYGYHENYYFGFPKKRIIPRLLAFLVTRQVFAGSGCILPEVLEGVFGGRFFLSQRALAANLWNSKERIGQTDNFAMFKCDDNIQSLFARLHIIVGDGNISSFATKLKIGSTALVVQLLKNGWRPPDELLITPRQAVKNIRRLAASPNFPDYDGWKFDVGRKTPSFMSALDVQQIYQAAAMKMFWGRDEETNWTLYSWRAVLEQLKDNPKAGVGRNLDWVMKLNLIDRLEGLGYSRGKLVKVDMSYHLADPDRGSFALVGNDDVCDAKVVQAMHHAPTDTRAAGRALVVRHLAEEIKRHGSLAKKLRIDWHTISYGDKVQHMISPKETYRGEARQYASRITRPNFPNPYGRMY